MVWITEVSIDGIYHTWTVCDAVARLTARRPTPGLLTGILACLDGYMNIAMEQTEEYENGQLKAKYGDAFIRGNNGARCPSQNLRSRTAKLRPPQKCLRQRFNPVRRRGLVSLAALVAVLYISTQKKK